MALRTFISWTGGKDSALSFRLCQLDPRFDVVGLVVFCPKPQDFKAHPLAVMRRQAEAMGLPLYEAIIDGPDFKASYIAALEDLQEKHDCSVIVTGDMDLVGSMPRNWIEECCEGCRPPPDRSASTGHYSYPIRAYLPLWGASREGVLKNLMEEGMRVVFSCVKGPWFDGTWIGREIDQHVIEQMQEMHERNSLDLGGEKGEYHTICVGGPIYKVGTSVGFTGLKAVELESQAGQANQRWWSIAFDDVQLVSADNTHAGGAVRSNGERRLACEMALSTLSRLRERLGNEEGRFRPALSSIPTFSALTDTFAKACAEKGFEVVHPFSAQWYNMHITELQQASPNSGLNCKLLPTYGHTAGCAAFLVGNTASVWPHFLRWCQERPRRRSNFGGTPATNADLDEPFDVFSEERVTDLCDRVLGSLGMAYSIFWSTVDKDGSIVSLQRAAEISGLAHLDTNTHLCIHPTYGAWFSMRAIVVVDMRCEKLPVLHPPLMPSPLSPAEVAEAQAALAAALASYEQKPDNPGRTDPADAWVALRRVVVRGREAHEFCEDQIRYHYRAKDRKQHLKKILVV